MKKFIYALPPEASVCTIAYRGYTNRVNVEKILFIYKSGTADGTNYNIVLELGSRIETWLVSEKTYNELLEMEYANS